MICNLRVLNFSSSIHALICLRKLCTISFLFLPIPGWHDAGHAAIIDAALLTYARSVPLSQRKNTKHKGIPMYVYTHA